MNKLLTLLSAVVFVSCTAGIPRKAVESHLTPDVAPDCAGVTIPVNIAPLTFVINDDAGSYMTCFTSSSGQSLYVKGDKVRPPVKGWRKLLDSSAGGEVRVQVFEKKEGVWTSLEPFELYVAADPVDEYISYRLIEPTYEISGDMCIAQRRLTDYKEREIFNNKMDLDESSRQCMNCHSYQAYRTSNMQFHVRQRHGGTIIIRNGKPHKVNLKADGLLSAGVYPSWHPSEPLIAYSVNATKQYFFAEGRQAAEVIDSYSDLMMYDPDSGQVSMISDDPDDLETFPYWSPDGNSLFYSCASTDSVTRAAETNVISNGYSQVRYNLMRRSFDLQTRTFGPAETLLDAASIGRSATFPRQSPADPYLLFTMAPFGNFHIWHKGSDLYLMDLRSGEYHKLDALCSDDVDSYHSWSSNGRWILFSSRREDGRYTRLYLSYFDREGNAHKPFIIPQSDPCYDKRLFKSYNIPEFMTEPVPFSPKRLLGVVKSGAVKAELSK